MIAPTRAQARAICIEGESGLLRALGAAVENWNRSDGELFVKNGAVIRVDGSDYGGERIEGKNLRGAWADEIGKWRKPKEAWEEALWFAVRKGERPRILATGTPKGMRGVVKLLLKGYPQGTVAVTVLSVEENRPNLSPDFYRSNIAIYAGTRLGRQEIDGEVLGDVPGALWKLEGIDADRITEQAWEELHEAYVGRTVVAIDPAVSAEEDSDETGIVAATLLDLPDIDGALSLGLPGVPEFVHAAVLADASGRYTPREWARAAIDLYHELGADRIVYERNQGGDMIEAVLRAEDPNVPLQGVWASKGKRTRAEPISALYEQRRIHHVGAFPDLESEMTTWVPGEDSPSRMDAAVWALTALMIEGSGENVFAEPLRMPEGLNGDILEAKW